jgi:hypothetical protein
MLRQWPECQARGEMALQLGIEGPFPSWEAIGRLTRGVAVARQGRADEGVAELSQGLALWEATGARLARPYSFAEGFDFLDLCDARELSEELKSAVNS